MTRMADSSHSDRGSGTVPAGPLIVELAGTPGSGKTTALTEVHRTLSQEGWVSLDPVADARSIAARTSVGQLIDRLPGEHLRDMLLWRVYLAYRLLGAGRVILRRPGHFMWLTNWQVRRPKEAQARRRRVLHWYLRLAGTQEFYRSQLEPGEAVVFDEGYVHRVVQLFSSPVDRGLAAEVVRYLNGVPTPDLVIHVEASPADCLERIHERGVWKRLEELTDAELEAFVHNADQVVRHAMDHAEACGWNVIVVDNAEAASSLLDRTSVAVRRGLPCKMRDFSGTPTRTVLANSAERPRVLMVVRLFHPWIGGTERQAHKLARQLIERGHSVRVVTGRWFRGTPSQEIIDGVRVFRHSTLWEFFGVKGLRKFGGYLYMVTLAWYLFRTRGDYDIIHIHGLNYHTAVATSVGRRLGKPTVVKLANSGMASDIDRTRSGRQLAGSRFLLPAALRCDRFVALSPAIADELQAAGVPGERVVSIPNGVEVESDIDAPSLDPSIIKVVFVGRLHRQKGVDVLLEACQVLLDRGKVGWSFRIIGDGPERTDLELLVERRNLQSVVEFVGEVGSPVSELDKADIFVLPSRTEGMSNALLEAMARSKPVVATAVPGSAAVVKDGETGLLVPPEDSMALADALETLAGDAETRMRLARRARSVIEDRYSMAEVAARYSALYEEMLGEQGVRPTERRRPAWRR